MDPNSLRAGQLDGLAKLRDRTAPLHSRLADVISDLSLGRIGRAAETLRAARAHIPSGDRDDLSYGLLQSSLGRDVSVPMAILLSADLPKRIESLVEMMWEDQVADRPGARSAALAFEAACDAERAPINPHLREAVMAVATRRLGLYQLELWWRFSEDAKSRLRQAGRDETWMFTEAIHPSSVSDPKFSVRSALRPAPPPALIPIWRESVHRADAQSFRRLVSDVVQPGTLAYLTAHTYDLLAPGELVRQMEAVPGLSPAELHRVADRLEMEGKAGPLLKALEEGIRSQPFACVSAALAVSLLRHEPRRALEVLEQTFQGEMAFGLRAIPSDLTLNALSGLPVTSTEDNARVLALTQRVALELGPVLPATYSKALPEVRQLLREAGMQRLVLGQFGEHPRPLPAMLSRLLSDFDETDCARALQGPTPAELHEAVAARLAQIKPVLSQSWTEPSPG